MRNTLCAFLAGASIAVAAGAGAATLDVGAGQTFTTLGAAIAAANVSPGEDTILLYDASYTLSGNPDVVEEPLIIQTVGQAVTITKTGGTGQVMRLNILRPTAGVGVFSIQGASTANPITIVNAVTNAPLLNSGPTTTATASVQLENVILQRPAAGTSSTGAFINYNNNGIAHSLTNVTFVGGDPANTGAVVLFGSNFGLTNVTLNNVDLSSGDYNGPRMSTSGVTFSATNTDFRRDLGDVVNINQAGVPFGGSTISLTDCIFQSGAANVIEGSLAPIAYSVVRPTVGVSGTSTGKFASFSGLGAASTIEILGSYTLLSDPLTDTDTDGMTDLWEIVGQLDPSSSAAPNGPTDDPDLDGASNLSEFTAGTNPSDAADAPAVADVPASGVAGLIALAAGLAGAGAVLLASRRRRA